jgi:KaiC/GvpD/RAD55 family RecA-like ATPase
MLDRMLGGGIPEDRSVLLAGGPGTGKSTVGMQFLQEGLKNDEECLFVSTEQTVDELRDSFSSFGFVLDDENLSVTSIHAKPGRTIESDDRKLVLQTLSGEGQDVLESFDAPFTSEYIIKYLDEYSPCERVVFDSALGLRAVSQSADVFNRTALDLIRLFSDEMEATSIFTSQDSKIEADKKMNPLHFTTHGVIRLWKSDVVGDRHRFLRIAKMRGVDHDRRRVELEFSSDGVCLSPDIRSQPPRLKTHEHVPIGVDGLDKLCGGGIISGAPVLLQHDGIANLTSILGSFLLKAVEEGYTLVLLSTNHLSPERMDSVLSETDSSVDSLIKKGRLFVLDVAGYWGRYSGKESVKDMTDDASDAESFISGAGSTDSHTFTVSETGATVHRLGSDSARELHHSQEVDTGPDDVMITVHNPSETSSSISGFFSNAAEQILDTRILDDGLQYVTLKKSPCGFVGSTSLVEFRREEPYFRVQGPPRGRGDPEIR